MNVNSRKALFAIVLVSVDLILINAGYLISFLLKFGWNIPARNMEAYLSTWPWLTISALCLLFFYRLYGSYRWRWSEVFASIICVVFFQALIAMAVSFLFRGFAFPRSVLIMAPFIHLVLLSLWRRAAWHIERGLQSSRRVIIVGSPFEAVSVAEKLESAPGGFINVVGLVIANRGVENNENVGTINNGQPYCESPRVQICWPVLGAVDDFCECLDAVKPDQVFLCSKLSQDDKAEVVYACVARDTTVFMVPDLYEIMLAQSRLEQVDDVPVFTVGRLAIPEEVHFIKRATDIMLSMIALLITIPLHIIVAMAIKLDSRGSILYRQKRLTLQGKPFYLYKYRTMVTNAEKDSGPVMARENDPRVTRVGRILRATRVDELPQLLNVLKGDMSLVGPRPERPFFVNELMKENPEYIYRMNVKSGITGLAQIAGKYSTSPEHKLKYDLLYTKSYSPAKDLAIMLQTLKVIFMKDRAS